MTTTTLNAAPSTGGAGFSSGDDGTLTIKTGATAGAQVNALSFTAAGIPTFDQLAQSLGSTSGYCTLPSGLIIQWGTSGVVALGTSGTVTFPIAFPAACVGLSAIANGSGVGFVTQISKSASGATLGHIAGTGSVNSATLYYIAVGY